MGLSRLQYIELLETLGQTQELLPQHQELGATIIPELKSEELELGLLMDKLPRQITTRDGDGELKIVRTIGQGGMGVIYLAKQRTLQREVAVKSVREDRRDLRSKRSMLQEAWVTGRLEHPNIVPVHTLGLDERGFPILVLKRIEGVGWDQTLTAPERLPSLYQGLEPLEAHLRILSQVCLATHFAHSRGILHRDLKPENVMLGEFGEVYLMDWGIAVSMNEEDRGKLPMVDEISMVAGTPVYMAPEMAAAEAANHGPHTDVYLLGAILHELLTLTPRHDGHHIEQVLFAAYLSKPFQYDERLPRELTRLCQQATARDPAQRPQSAQEFRQAIERYLVHRQSHALVAEAQALIEANDDDQEELDQRYTMAIFALKQALRVWADNEEAARRLDQLFLKRCELALEREQLELAGAILREWGHAPQPLLTRVEEAQAAASLSLAKLQERANAMDISVAQRHRGRLAALLAVMWGASNSSVAALSIAGIFEITPKVHLGMGVLFAVALGLIVSTQRKLWQSNQANRKILEFLICTTVTDLTIRSLSYHYQISVSASTALLLFGYAAQVGVLALFLDRRLFIAMSIFALAGLGALEFSGLAALMLGVGSVLGMSSIAYVWWHDDKLSCRLDDLIGLDRRGQAQQEPSG